MRPLDDSVQRELNRGIAGIGKQLGDVDTMSVISPIFQGLDERVRYALETKAKKSAGIAIILETQGGVVEVIERIVQTIRHFYDEVSVIVPGEAMSAGTVFALSADHILMDYFSRLGPIDPQVFKDGRLVPALAYLNQYEKLHKKAEKGGLTTAEYLMLDKLDLGELYQFEQARELSVELLINWLSQYKFKNWEYTESAKKRVTQSMRQQRAKEIAQLLNDSDRWHSHGRGIGISTLRGELNLKIEDYSENEKLSKSINSYFRLLMDYLVREKQISPEKQISFVHHNEEYF